MNKTIRQHDARSFHTAGFTLIELLTTLAVASILTFVAVPSYRSFVEKNRMATATNDFITDINFTRIESIKRQKGTTGAGQMVICPSTAGTSCSAAPATWNAGWIVFWDLDGNSVYASGTDTLLKIHGALPASVQASAAPAVPIAFNKIGALTSSQTSVTFTNTGRTNTVCLSGGPGRAMLLANYGVNCPP